MSWSIANKQDTDSAGLARAWRDMELAATDQVSYILDWPNRDNIISYRQALREWPSTSNFPGTRPELS